jgi:hypothetical protein
MTDVSRGTIMICISHFRYAPGDPPLWMEDSEKDVEDTSKELEAKSKDNKVDEEGYAWVRAVVWAIEGRELVIQVSGHTTFVTATR